MTAFEEFKRNREFGELGWQLLTTLMGEELRKLPGLASQSSDELSDYVMEFIAKRGKSLVARITAEIDNEDRFGRYIRVSIRHWLIDEIRKTDIGALRRQIETLLRNSSFEQVPTGAPGAGRWRLAGTNASPWGGDPSILDAAARSVPVERVQRKGTRRRPPIGTSTELIHVLSAIFHAVNGSLETAQIVDVFTRRFPATLKPTTLSSDYFEIIGIKGTQFGDNGTYGNPERSLLEAEESEDLRICALTVYEWLDPLERQLVLVLHDIKSICTLLGCRESKAYLERDRVSARIKEYAGDSVDHLELFRVLRDMCP